MPLHVETFVKAYLRLRFPEDRVSVSTGLYGDVEGNIRRASESDAEGAIVILEWSDLDPRLGFRASAGWAEHTFEDIASEVEDKCRRLEASLVSLAQSVGVVVAGPTLPLPPVTHFPPLQISDFELRLKAMVVDFLRRICKVAGVRVVNPEAMAASSPASSRHDLKMELAVGFPYSLQHADTLARLSVSCLFPSSPKKGLITDLDQTLWKGILGDAGVEGVSWSLEEKAQAHGLYQQVLASMAHSGVLVAIASKNDPQLVERALQRPDLRIKCEQIFPVDVSWGAKSDGVGRILKAWNIGAESVVFVDDSPMELAEVAEKYPGIECLQFPSDDPAGVLALLETLRLRFGKENIREEDRLRLQSLRVAATFERGEPREASADFLARLKAKITFDPAGAEHPRALELINKTNQFNLNGARFTEAEWRARIRRPDSFLMTVSYEDRFGPLGRIAVIGGYMEMGRCVVDVWVMSCRAFSRHIEYQTLRQVFAATGASAIRFLFQPTGRNGPLQGFLGRFIPPEALAPGGVELPAAVFEASCPTLCHEVIEEWKMSKSS